MNLKHIIIMQVNDLYGVDWDGPIPEADDIPHVRVYPPLS